MLWISLLLVLLLTGEGLSQCFTSNGCTGDQVPADNQRECCVGTNTGLSYYDGGSCTVCIGNVCNYRTPNETKFYTRLDTKGSHDVIIMTFTHI